MSHSGEQLLSPISHTIPGPDPVLLSICLQAFYCSWFFCDSSFLLSSHLKCCASLRVKIMSASCRILSGWKVWDVQHQSNTCAVTGNESLPWWRVCLNAQDRQRDKCNKVKSVFPDSTARQQPSQQQSRSPSDLRPTPGPANNSSQPNMGKLLWIPN